MRNLFLASSLKDVVEDVAKHIPAGKRRLVLITTAGEAKPEPHTWIDLAKKKLTENGFEVTDYTFTNHTAEDLSRDLASFDCICVEGGNTYYLLQQMQKSGAKDVIRDLVENGRIYIGSSAGSIVTCPTIGWTGKPDDRDAATELQNTEGLGLVPFLVLPHWGDERRNERHAAHNVPLLQKEKRPTILLDDSHYIHVEGDSFRILP